MMVNNDNNGDNNGYLVGGWPTHLEKYEFVNGKDDIPYIGKIIQMFQTTNQI